MGRDLKHRIRPQYRLFYDRGNHGNHYNTRKRAVLQVSHYFLYREYNRGQWRIERIRAAPEQPIGINAITYLGAKPNQRPTYEANAAQSYTVGPSRPRLAPVPIDIVPKINLLIGVRNRIRPNFK